MVYLIYDQTTDELLNLIHLNKKEKLEYEKTHSNIYLKNEKELSDDSNMSLFFEEEKEFLDEDIYD